MKFSNEGWQLFQQRFGFPNAQRMQFETQLTADEAAFLRKAGGNEAKALGLLVLDTAREMGRTLRIDENFVLKQLIKYAPRQGRNRLKKALRLARGGH